MVTQKNNTKKPIDHIDHYLNVDDDNESSFGAALFRETLGFSIEDLLNSDKFENIIKVARRCNIAFSGCGDVFGEGTEPEHEEYINIVLNPIKEAIANNDQNVIALIEACNDEDRELFNEAIEAGLRDGGAINERKIREGYERVVNLHQTIRENSKWV